MAQITALYRAGLADKIGTRKECFEAATVSELLRLIRLAHGNAVYKQARSMLIAVNGVSISYRKFFATPLNDGDEVKFLPLAAGG